MTPLTKSVFRKCVKMYSGRLNDARGRVLVVALMPGDTLMLRPARTKRAEYIQLEDVYEIALYARVRSERMQKLNAKKRRRK